MREQKCSDEHCQDGARVRLTVHLRDGAVSDAPLVTKKGLQTMLTIRGLPQKTPWRTRSSAAKADIYAEIQRLLPQVWQRLTSAEAKPK